MNEPTIDQAQPRDLSAVFALLEEHHLPIDGLAAHLATTMVARWQGQVVGSAALEPYADGALLRSVAVSTEWRGRGIGGQLIAAALERASALKAPAVYLLTTTADSYFPKFGFARITRGDVPESVRASVEFTSACPSSAVVMRRIWNSSHASHSKFRIANSQLRDPTISPSAGRSPDRSESLSVPGTTRPVQ